MTLTKGWYKQKSFWAGLSLMLAGVGSLVTGEGLSAGLASMLPALAQIAAGLGIVGLRQALERILSEMASSGKK